MGVPNTENSAVSIRQAGANCVVARQLAGLAVRTYFGRSFKTTNWNCVSHLIVPQGLQYNGYVCIDHANHLVTFDHYG